MGACRRCYYIQAAGFAIKKYAQTLIFFNYTADRQKSDYKNPVDRRGPAHTTSLEFLII
jgi:hypothetical protein